MTLMKCCKLSDKEGLEEFKNINNTTGPRILLLSLQKDASGMNLQSANHVMFVHPMCESIDKAVAYELQAIEGIHSK